MKTKIMQALKPKVASLGFNLDERKSIAEQIADNLNLKDGATDEEINAAISAQIDAVLPFLQMSQKTSTRVINDYKEKNPATKSTKTSTDVDDDDDSNGGGKKSTKKNDDDEPTWAKALRESNEAMIAKMNSIDKAKKSSDYRARLAEDLKGVKPKFYSREAEKMEFEDDAAYEAYVERVTDDWAEFNQEEADDDLSKSATPSGGGQTKTDVESFATTIVDGTKTQVESLK